MAGPGKQMWDSRYGEPGFAFGESPNDFLVQVADRLPSGPVLCLAEGEGRNGVFLAERGHDVLAVDYSAVGLDKAARLAEQRGVSLRTELGDLETYEIQAGHWASMVSIFCHLPPPLRRRVHQAVVRGLRPGGAFVLEAYTPAQLELRTGGPPVRPLLYTLEELREELAGLQLEIAAELEREVHEGQYHHGRGAVVQVLGFKAGA